jgi:hypothetical protein
MKYPPKVVYGYPDKWTEVGEEQDFNILVDDIDRVPEGIVAVYEFKELAIIHRETNVARATPEEVEAALNGPPAPKMEPPF